MKKTTWGACLLAPALAAAQGYLENPQPDAVESGIGIVSGWHCTARDVSIYVDGVYAGRSGVGSLRPDTRALCGGRAETGFSLLYNFNELPPGAHRIDVHVDGRLFASRSFRSVRSGGVPFLQGVAREVKVEGFPTQGSTATLTWSQARQGFVVTGFDQPAGPQSEACEKTALVAGTWSFHYTVVSAFSGRFNLPQGLVATGNADFPCMLRGTDESGNRDVTATYVLSLGEWMFIDEGPSFERVFVMKMTTPTRLDGRYYQSISGNLVSSAYAAHALKTASAGGRPGVLQAPAVPADEGAARALEQAEDAALATLRPAEPAPPDLQRIVEQTRHWLRLGEPGAR